MFFATARFGSFLGHVTAMLCVLAVPYVAFPAATVSVSGVPATLTPGQPVSITVSYTKDGTEPEKRVVILAELHALPSGALVSKTVMNNGGAGYTQASHSIACSVSVPVNASGSYYFSAVVAPWSLNKAVVAQYKTYPTNGTYTYLWSGGGYGVTQNLYYMSVLAAPKPSGNTTYCSGLAFDAFLSAFNSYNTSYAHPRIGNIMSSSQMETFRRIFYGVTDSEKLSVRAIADWGVGREITDFEEAQEGDFVQLWRHSTSGHNPLFVNWIRNSSNVITGVRYWGSQGSTNGIGYNTESFGVSTGINPARFYIGRAAKPRDQADYDWALGQASSQSSPSIVPAAVDEWRQYQ